MSSSREEKEIKIELPEDILMHALDMLSVGGLSACARTNQTFFKLTNELKKTKFPRIHEEIFKELNSLPCETLCRRGEGNEELALYILSSNLYIKFGAHMTSMVSYFQKLLADAQGSSEQMATWTDKVTQWKGEWLFRIGNAHASVAKNILESKNIRVKLSDEQIQKLAEKLSINDLKQAESTFRSALGGQYRSHYHIARLR